MLLPPMPGAIGGALVIRGVVSPVADAALEPDPHAVVKLWGVSRSILRMCTCSS
jgi:hypothetical protein